MRRLIAISTLALTLGAASLAAAGPAPSGPGPSGPPPPECVPPGLTPGVPPPPGYQPPPDWRPPAQCSQYGPPPGPGGPGPAPCPAGAPCPPGAGGPGPDFAPAFFSRNWKILGQVLITDTPGGKQVIDFNVDKLLNPPKLLRDEGTEVADQGALVIVGPKVAITENGKRITFAQLQADDHLNVTGKFLRTDKWLDDEDGDPAPTVRAKRIQVVS